MDVQFESELSKIGAADDSIEPEVLRGVNFVKFKDATDVADTSPSANKNKNRWQKSKKSPSEMLRQTLMDINKQRMEHDKTKHEREQAKAEEEAMKENNKQRRHEEKMNLMKLLFQNNLQK